MERYVFVSDIAIPGVNSKFQSEKTVEKLVKAESVKLDKLNSDKELYELQKTTWQDLNRTMSSLRTTAKNMFGFENPFNERSANSSDTKALTASASREAVEGTTRLEVLKLASPDRFISKELAKDAQVAAGLYEFVIGEDTISMRYRGGSLKDFAENLSRRAEGIMKASVIQTKPDTQVLLIEGTKPGSAYAISFKQESINWGLETGLIEKVQNANVEFAPTKNKGYTVAPGEQTSLPLPSGFTPAPGMVLELKTKLVRNPDSWKPPPAAPGPQLPLGPEAALQTLRIRDITSDFPATPENKATPPPEIQDAAILFATLSSGEKKLPDVQDSNDFVSTTISLEGDLSTIQALSIRNNNTFKTLTIMDARIYDPTARDDYKPRNAVSLASNARIRLEGVDIDRPTNTITDVIPGVTLNLLETSEKPFNLKVEPDRKLVKDKLIEFVAQYNAVIREINILSARKDNLELVNELDFLTKDEKDEYKKKLGLYQGDSTLSMVKNRLQNIAINPYETRAGRALSVLGQTGISTNAQSGTTGVQGSSLRGYLEINEKTLDKVLSDNFLAVKDLFGRDSNGDLLVDNGIAYQMDNYIQPYVQTGGLIVGRTNTIDTQIKNKKQEIDKFEAYLKKFESDLKQKYGKMEGAINQLESSSRDIRSLDKK